MTLLSNTFQDNAEARKLFDEVWSQMRAYHDSEGSAFRWFAMGYAGSRTRITELETALKELQAEYNKLVEDVNNREY